MFGRNEKLRIYWALIQSAFDLLDEGRYTKKDERAIEKIIGKLNL